MTSLSLQADSVNLNKANRLIVRQVEIFTSRKADGGEHYVIASEAVNAGEYCGVTTVCDYTSVNLQHPSAYLLVRNGNIFDSRVPA